MLRPPAQLIHNPLRACIQNAWITRTSSYNPRINALPSHLLHLRNDLPHGIGCASADVVAMKAWIVHMRQRENMRIGDVAYVHKVAQARAIRRFVIVAIDVEALAVACRGIQHQRNQVRFRLVSLALLSCGAGGAEITERKHAPAVRARVPLQYLLEYELGFTVRIE